MQLNEKQIAALNEYRAAKRASSLNAPALSPKEQAGKNLEQYGAGLATAASYAASGMDDELMARVAAAGTLPITSAIDVANRLGANIPNPMAGKSWDEIVSAEENRNRAQNKEAMDKASLTTSILGGVGGTVLNPLSRIFPNSMTAQGAIVSGAQGFGEGEGGTGDRIVKGVEGAVKGAAFGLAGDALVKGGGAALNYLGKKTNPPAALEKITEYRKKAYKYIEDSDFVIAPEKMTEMGKKIATRVLPKTAQELELMKRGNKAVIQKLGEFDEIMAGTPTTLKATRMYDAGLNDAITDSIKLGNKATTDTKYLYDLQDEFRASLDEAAEGLPPAARDANFLNTQERKIGDIFRMIENSSYTQSPQAYLNTQFKRILDKGRGWSDIDKKFIKMIMKEDFGDEALRAIGSRLSSIGQLAQGNVGASLLQSGVSSLARNTKDARKLAKVDRLVTHLGRESAKRIKQMEYINAPKPTSAAEVPNFSAPKPKPQLLLPAPQTPIAVTRQGQAAPMTAEQFAQSSATRQAMQQSGRLEALRAQEPPIYTPPAPVAQPVAATPKPRVAGQSAKTKQIEAARQETLQRFERAIDEQLPQAKEFRQWEQDTAAWNQAAREQKDKIIAGLREQVEARKLDPVEWPKDRIDAEFKKIDDLVTKAIETGKSPKTVTTTGEKLAFGEMAQWAKENPAPVAPIPLKQTKASGVEGDWANTNPRQGSIKFPIKTVRKDNATNYSVMPTVEDINKMRKILTKKLKNEHYYQVPLTAGAAGAAAYALSPQDAKAQTLTQDQQNALIEYRAMKRKEQPTRITINPAAQGTQGVPDVQLPATIPDTPLSQDIRQNEGMATVVYDDTTGNRTVGNGFNLDSGIARKAWKQAGIQADFDKVYNGEQAITPYDAELLLNQGMNVAVADADKLYPRMQGLSPSQQEALTELSYNLGLPRLSKFTEFNKAINNGDKINAVRHLMKSKWVTQVGKTRARKIASKLLMET